jgi:hypothetical protein
MPFGKYKDFAACVAANQDKDDPKAFCAALEQKSKNKTEKLFEVRKFDDAQNLVYGFASIIEEDGRPLTDRQGDQIDLPDLEEATVDFMLNHRATGVMHQGDEVGAVVESFVSSPAKGEAMGLAPDIAKNLPTGYWIGVKVTPQVFAKVKSGELSMFSIEGEALREEVVDAA